MEIEHSALIPGKRDSIGQWLQLMLKGSNTITPLQNVELSVHAKAT
jgi:hypothetical protein